MKTALLSLVDISGIPSRPLSSWLCMKKTSLEHRTSALHCMWNL